MERTPKPGWSKSRRYVRFTMATSAKVHIEGKAGDTVDTLYLVTKNISAGGAFFQTSSPLSGGTRVRVELSLPVEKLKNILGGEHDRGFHVRVHGTVLRSLPDGMAVAFDDDYQIAPLK